VFDSDYLKIELQKGEDAIDSITLASKRVEQAIEELKGVISLLLVSSSNDLPEAMAKLTEALRLGNEIQINNAFSLRQLFWAQRPKL
jgi:hypothetical protein